MSRRRSDRRALVAAVTLVAFAAGAGSALGVADLSLRVEDVSGGAGAQFLLTPFNAGPDTANGGVLITVRVAGATASGASGTADTGCEVAADTVVCTTFDLAAGGGTQPVVGFTYPGPGTYTLVAQIRSSTGEDPNPANDTVTLPITVTGPTTPTPGALPAPVQGRLVNASRVSGVVRIRRPGGRFVVLQAGQQIPVGSIVDVTRGRVRLESAGATAGAVNSAEFYRGQFRVAQRRGASLTQLFLQGGNLAACPRRSASASELQRKRSRKPSPRRLWGKGKGDYQTVGRNSSTSVRGTTWLVEDRCDGTFTRVTEGRVAVRDFVRRRTVLLRAPQTYLARRR